MKLNIINIFFFKFGINFNCRDFVKPTYGKKNFIDVP